MNILSKIFCMLAILALTGCGGGSSGTDSAAASAAEGLASPSAVNIVD